MAGLPCAAGGLRGATTCRRCACSSILELPSHPDRPHPTHPHLQFDYVVGMDASNVAAIRRAAEHWRGASPGSPVPPDYPAKLSLMTDYLQSSQFKGKYGEVPDP